MLTTDLSQMVYLLHNKKTGGIPRKQFVDELKQLCLQMIREVKGRDQIMVPEPTKGFGDSPSFSSWA
jgi:hypothetical protein